MPVVDASLLVALALDDHRAPAVEDLMLRWTRDDEAMHAPMLIRYEVASGLTRAAAAGAIGVGQVSGAWSAVLGLPVTYHELEDGPAVVDVALDLARRSAYDAAYLALALHLRSELWTFDARLVRNARRLGYPVRLVEVGGQPE